MTSAGADRGVSGGAGACAEPPIPDKDTHKIARRTCDVLGVVVGIMIGSVSCARGALLPQRHFE